MKPLPWWQRPAGTGGGRCATLLSRSIRGDIRDADTTTATAIRPVSERFLIPPLTLVHTARAPGCGSTKIRWLFLSSKARPY